MCHIRSTADCADGGDDPQVKEEKVHRLLYHSTLGSRVIKKKKMPGSQVAGEEGTEGLAEESTTPKPIACHITRNKCLPDPPIRRRRIPR